MKEYAALLFFLALCIFNACSSTPGTPIASPSVYRIPEPAAGNYPQGLYKYPYRQNTPSTELFTQTLAWSPPVAKTFAADTPYTAVLTLSPVSSRYTFEGIEIADVQGLPEKNVSNITAHMAGKSMIINIEFEKTAAENAAPELLFEDNFEGAALDNSQWAICPEWDRQGRSTWTPDMVSVSGGFLHLKFKRDAALGKSKTSNTKLSDNWIRAGGIRSKSLDENILYENTFGYYEARIKFPQVSGTWGAFWLMSPTQWMLGDEGVDGTEIDIVETIHNEENKYNAALHWNGYGSNHKDAGSDKTAENINIYDGEFHIFALDWSPQEYIFYVDGVEFWRGDGGASFKNSGINQNPNYIKLTVEGADWAGALPDGFTEAEMLVDYVRVYNQPKAVP